MEGQNSNFCYNIFTFVKKVTFHIGKKYLWGATTPFGLHKYPSLFAVFYSATKYSDVVYILPRKRLSSKSHCLFCIILYEVNFVHKMSVSHVNTFFCSWCEGVIMEINKMDVTSLTVNFPGILDSLSLQC